MLKTPALALLGIVCLAASAPHAEVVDSSSSGFTVKITQHVSAPVARTYATALAVGSWWQSSHTYSGNAANLTIDPKAGGCWCEKLPGGGTVQHMQVVFVMPNEVVRFTGGLGPLQTMAAAGAMQWEFKAAGDGTDLTCTYAVGGYTPGGFQPIAAAVDQVLSEQLAQLKATAEKK